jgi:hydrogenase maturation protease
LLWSFVSVHTILAVRGGEFISLLDPPEAVRGEAAACVNRGTYPVLVGEPGEHDVMLSSPIILYDYPQIAPESAGDFFDSTEMDEMLTLRVMTLTEGEKNEMRRTDPRVRDLLARTEATAREQLARTHGVVRSLRPIKDDAA